MREVLQICFHGSLLNGVWANIFGIGGQGDIWPTAAGKQRLEIMTKGTRYPAEGRSWVDVRTGARIRQVTAHPSIHHHPFFLIPAYDDAMTRLFLVSHRTGNLQLFAAERATGLLVQVTPHPELAEWSVSPSRNGRYVYFTTGTRAWRVETATFRTEELLNFGTAEMCEQGRNGSAMGTTAVSYDDHW